MYISPQTGYLRSRVMAAVKGKVVEGGRIIVPAAFRKSMGLSKGDTVFMELHGDELSCGSAQHVRLCAASKPSCAPSHQARAPCLTS